MKGFIHPHQPYASASAPGRMDVMGGIADYSGALLLQMPIRQRTTATVQYRSDGWIHVRSRRTPGGPSFFSMHSEEVSGCSLKALSAKLKTLDGGDWGAYVIGCIAVWLQYLKRPAVGLSIDIHSSVPEGKGVSSSAALEVSVMAALVKLFGAPVGQYDIPLMAQQVENEVVGAPCGLMDQLSTYFGRKGKLLPVICQPCSVEDSLSFPSDLRFCAIDSGVRHAVSGESYTTVRTAAFMAYSLIALQEGGDRNLLTRARSTGNWSALPFKGYLCNIPLSTFRKQYLPILPEKLRGSDFLAMAGSHTDPATEIVPDKVYALRACATHPVEEHHRICLFRELVQALSRSKARESVFSCLGELMLQSHAGYNAVGLGNEKTDRLVNMLMEAGQAHAIYGAHVSGGGSGGTVVVVCKGEKGVDAAKSIWKRYNTNEQQQTIFFSGSSNGAFYV